MLCIAFLYKEGKTKTFFLVVLNHNYIKETKKISRLEKSTTIDTINHNNIDWKVALY